MIRVCVVDRHPVVRAGLRDFFRGTDIETTAEADSIKDAYLLLPRYLPEILITDIAFGKEDPWAYLKHAKTLIPKRGKIIIYTADIDPANIVSAVTAEVCDFLDKSCPKEHLIEAVHAALEGRPPIPNGEMGRLTGTTPPGTVIPGTVIPGTVIAGTTSGTGTKGSSAPSAHDGLLTDREHQVLQRIALGLSNKEIAKQLHISDETVKEHVRNILRKTGQTRRTQAAVWGLRHGIVNWPAS